MPASMTRAEALKELGLTEFASDAEIKSAYRKLARKHHPDVDPKGTVKMAAINAAYDRLTRDADESDPTAAPPPPEDPFANWGEWESEETSSQSKNSKIGKSIYLTIDVPWEAANLGRPHVVSYKVLGKPKRITIKIPKGSSTGKQIRCAGRGEPGAGGGIAGDLFITLNVIQDTHIEEIHTSLTLRSSEIKNPTTRQVNVVVDGYLKSIPVNVPAHIKNGQVIRVIGVGHKSVIGKSRGDVVVKVYVVASKPGKDIETYATIDAFLALKMSLFGNANVTLRDVATHKVIDESFNLDANFKDGVRSDLGHRGEPGDPGERSGKLWVTPRYTVGARQLGMRSSAAIAALVLLFVLIAQNGDSTDVASYEAPIEESYEAPVEEPQVETIEWPPVGLEYTEADIAFAYAFYDSGDYTCSDDTAANCILFKVASEQDCSELSVKARFFDSNSAEEEWVENLFYDFQAGVPQDVELNVYTRSFDTVSSPEIFCSVY
jgi:curved DNA-binding protein